MIERFIAHIGAIHPLSPACGQALAAALEVVEYPKKHRLLQEGERSDYAFFVLEGLLRAYYIKDETEVCCRFMHENHIGLSINSFYTRKPSFVSIETIEKSVIARIHYDQLQQLYRTYPEFNYVARVWTEQYASMTEYWFFMLRKQTAEERYHFFLKKYPNLILRVPLTYIASFLGINLETLSRLRNKLSK